MITLLSVIVFMVVNAIIVFSSIKGARRSIDTYTQLLENYKEEIVHSISRVEDKVSNNTLPEFTLNELCGHPTIFPSALESEHLKIDDKLYLLEFTSENSILIDLENKKYLSSDDTLDLAEEWREYMKYNPWKKL